MTPRPPRSGYGRRASPRAEAAPPAARAAPPAPPASPAATWPAPPRGGPPPPRAARPAAERGPEAAGPARPRSDSRRGAGPSALPAPPPGPSMETAEKECGALGGLFQAIVNDMKVTGADATRCVSPWGTRGGGSRVPPCRGGPASVCPCLSASGLCLPCALVSGCPSWGVWARACLGVRAIPRVHAPGRPGRSAPLGSRPEPAHTRASRAPDPQTMNGGLAPGATHGPLKGPGSLRPLLYHPRGPLPRPRRPRNPDNAVTAKAAKNNKQGTVNSFPASLASAPAARAPNQLQDPTVCARSGPGPKASDLPWGEEGEGGPEGAAPGEDCRLLQALSSSPSLGWPKVRLQQATNSWPTLAHQVGKPRLGTAQGH